MNQNPGRHSGGRHRSQPSSGALTVSLLVTAWLLFLTAAAVASRAADPAGHISREAATSCASKVKKLEDFAARPASGKRQTTRFTQDEVNSYLALDLSAKYNPCLRSLTLVFEETRLQGEAVIDFDRLGMTASRMLARLVAVMFHGTHKLSARGKLVSQGGKANFQLEESRFDGTSLPRSLVEEIITAVGKKQKPPFDPMQPSQMPYGIDRVELHAGYIIVYQ